MKKEMEIKINEIEAKIEANAITLEEVSTKLKKDLVNMKEEIKTEVQ